MWMVEGFDKIGSKVGGQVLVARGYSGEWRQGKKLPGSGFDSCVIRACWN